MRLASLLIVGLTSAAASAAAPTVNEAPTALVAPAPQDPEPQGPQSRAPTPKASAPRDPASLENAAEGRSGQDPAQDPEEGNVQFRYEDGLDIWTRDGTFRIHVDWRAQFRATNLESDEHPTAEDLVSDQSDFAINRARIKTHGHAFEEWVRFKFEYDLADSRLLDLFFTLQDDEAIGLRVGQYKVLYNRERVDSSGELQFAERSIVTRPFTLDRQQGVTLLGRLGAGSLVDSEYALGVCVGTGRGGGEGEDGGRPMVLGRWQWNFLGRPMPFEESDLERSEETAAALAIAGCTNSGRYTRFSSDGPGQLDGLPDGQPNQYAFEQAMAEFALKHRGLYAQAEVHWKEVRDRMSGDRTELRGYYAQLGYFFGEVWTWFPPELELGLRNARVERDFPTGERAAQLETSAVGNWFFHGHRNKLTLEISYVGIEDVPGQEDDDGVRARLQWDVSF